jgi:hypothetical protein
MSDRKLFVAPSWTGPLYVTALKSVLSVMSRNIAYKRTKTGLRSIKFERQKLLIFFYSHKNTPGLRLIRNFLICCWCRDKRRERRHGRFCGATWPVKRYFGMVEWLYHWLYTFQIFIPFGQQKSDMLEWDPSRFCLGYSFADHQQPFWECILEEKKEEISTELSNYEWQKEGIFAWILPQTGVKISHQGRVSASTDLIIGIKQINEEE